MFAPVPVQLLVVEAHLACGRVVEVIRSEGFRMPRSDLEMLVQSHTEGAKGGKGGGPLKSNELKRSVVVRALGCHTVTLSAGAVGVGVVRLHTEGAA